MVDSVDSALRVVNMYSLRISPVYATWYVARRYVLPRFFNFDMNELPPQRGTLVANVVEFEKLVSELSVASHSKTPGILFLYPGKDEYIGTV
jgi:hypothetical protein